MKQPIKTPPIAPCARCGADAKCIKWPHKLDHISDADSLYFDEVESW